MALTIGIDWGNHVHSVCVLDEDKAVVVDKEIANTGKAIQTFVRQMLVRVDHDAGRLDVAIETPHGAVVEAFAACGAHVYHINPKQLDRFRDRFFPSGAKDDQRDAYVLAHSLMTDKPRFHAVRLNEQGWTQLRDMSRLYQSLTSQVVALGNQIRQQLGLYYLQLDGLGQWHKQPFLWDLFEAAPTPQFLRGLRQKDLKALLKKHRIRRHNPNTLLRTLTEQQDLPATEVTIDTASEHIRILLPILRATHQQRRATERRIHRLLYTKATDDEGSTMHRDAQALLALPAMGEHIGAAMLAEAGQALQCRDYQKLRCLSGTAPVSRRTGGRRKKPQVIMRRACNPRLRTAVHHWAQAAIRYDARSRAHYAKLRAKGHGYARCLRGVGDRLLKLAVAVLASGKPFDPEQWNRCPATPKTKKNVKQRLQSGE